MKELLDILDQLRFYTNASSVSVAKADVFVSLCFIWYDDDLVFQLNYTMIEIEQMKVDLMDAVLQRVHSELKKYKKGNPE